MFILSLLLLLLFPFHSLVDAATTTYHGTIFPQGYTLYLRLNSTSDDLYIFSNVSFYPPGLKIEGVSDGASILIENSVFHASSVAAISFAGSLNNKSNFTVFNSTFFQAHDSSTEMISICANAANNDYNFFEDAVISVQSNFFWKNLDRDGTSNGKLMMVGVHGEMCRDQTIRHMTLTLEGNMHNVSTKQPSSSGSIGEVTLLKLLELTSINSTFLVNFNNHFSNQMSVLEASAFSAIPITYNQDPNTTKSVYNPQIIEEQYSLGHLPFPSFFEEDEGTAQNYASASSVLNGFFPSSVASSVITVLRSTFSSGGKFIVRNNVLRSIGFGSVTAVNPSQWKFENNLFPPRDQQYCIYFYLCTFNYTQRMSFSRNALYLVSDTALANVHVGILFHETTIYGEILFWRESEEMLLAGESTATIFGTDVIEFINNVIFCFTPTAQSNAIKFESSPLYAVSTLLLKGNAINVTSGDHGESRGIFFYKGPLQDLAAIIFSENVLNVINQVSKSGNQYMMHGVSFRECKISLWNSSAVFGNFSTSSSSSSLTGLSQFLFEGNSFHMITYQTQSAYTILFLFSPISSGGNHDDEMMTLSSSLRFVGNNISVLSLALTTIKSIYFLQSACSQLHDIVWDSNIITANQSVGGGGQDAAGVAVSFSKFEKIGPPAPSSKKKKKKDFFSIMEDVDEVGGIHFINNNFLVSPGGAIYFAQSTLQNISVLLYLKNNMNVTSGGSDYCSCLTYDACSIKDLVYGVYFLSNVLSAYGGAPVGIHQKRTDITNVLDGVFNLSKNVFHVVGIATQSVTAMHIEKCNFPFSNIDSVVFNENNWQVFSASSDCKGLFFDDSGTIKSLSNLRMDDNYWNITSGSGASMGIHLYRTEIENIAISYAMERNEFHVANQNFRQVIAVHYDGNINVFSIQEVKFENNKFYLKSVRILIGFSFYNLVIDQITVFKIRWNLFDMEVLHGSGTTVRTCGICASGTTGFTNMGVMKLNGNFQSRSATNEHGNAAAVVGKKVLNRGMFFSGTTFQNILILRIALNVFNDSELMKNVGPESLSTFVRFISGTLSGIGIFEIHENDFFLKAVQSPMDFSFVVVLFHDVMIRKVQSMQYRNNNVSVFVSYLNHSSSSTSIQSDNVGCQGVSFIRSYIGEIGNFKISENREQYYFQPVALIHSVAFIYFKEFGVPSHQESGEFSFENNVYLLLESMFPPTAETAAVDATLSSSFPSEWGNTAKNFSTQDEREKLLALLGSHSSSAPTEENFNLTAPSIFSFRNTKFTGIYFSDWSFQNLKALSFSGNKIFVVSILSSLQKTYHYDHNATVEGEEEEERSLMSSLSEHNISSFIRSHFYTRLLTYALSISPLVQNIGVGFDHTSLVTIGQVSFKQNVLSIHAQPCQTLVEIMTTSVHSGSAVENNSSNSTSLFLSEIEKIKNRHNFGSSSCQICGLAFENSQISNISTSENGVREKDIRILENNISLQVIGVPILKNDKQKEASGVSQRIIDDSLMSIFGRVLLQTSLFNIFQEEKSSMYKVNHTLLRVPFSGNRSGERRYLVMISSLDDGNGEGTYVPILWRNVQVSEISSFGIYSNHITLLLSGVHHSLGENISNFFLTTMREGNSSSKVTSSNIQKEGLDYAFITFDGKSKEDHSTSPAGFQSGILFSNSSFTNNTGGAGVYDNLIIVEVTVVKGNDSVGWENGSSIFSSSSRKGKRGFLKTLQLSREVNMSSAVWNGSEIEHHAVQKYVGIHLYRTIFSVLSTPTFTVKKYFSHNSILVNLSVVNPSSSSNISSLLQKSTLVTFSSNLSNVVPRVYQNTTTVVNASSVRIFQNMTWFGHVMAIGLFVDEYSFPVQIFHKNFISAIIFDSACSNRNENEGGYRSNNVMGVVVLGINPGSNQSLISRDWPFFDSRIFVFSNTKENGSAGLLSAHRMNDEETSVANVNPLESSGNNSFDAFTRMHFRSNNILAIVASQVQKGATVLSTYWRLPHYAGEINWWFNEMNAFLVTSPSPLENLSSSFFSGMCVALWLEATGPIHNASTSSSLQLLSFGGNAFRSELRQFSTSFEDFVISGKNALITVLHKLNASLPAAGREEVFFPIATFPSAALSEEPFSIYVLLGSILHLHQHSSQLFLLTSVHSSKSKINPSSLLPVKNFSYQYGCNRLIRNGKHEGKNALFVALETLFTAPFPSVNYIDCTPSQTISTTSSLAPTATPSSPPLSPTSSFTPSRLSLTPSFSVSQETSRTRSQSLSNEEKKASPPSSGLIIGGKAKDAAGGIGPVSGAIGGVVTGPTLLFQQSRNLMLLHIGTCQFSHDEPIEWENSPTRLALGPSFGAYYRGTIVGSFLIIFGYFLLLIFIGILTSYVRPWIQRHIFRRKVVVDEKEANKEEKEKETAAVDGKNRRRFVLWWNTVCISMLNIPGSLIVPFGLVLPGVIMSSTAILVHSQFPDDRFLSLGGYAFVLIVSSWIGWRLMMAFYATSQPVDNEEEPPPSSFSSSPSGMENDNDEKTKSSSSLLLKNMLSGWFDRSSEWTPLSSYPQFVDMFSPLFDDSRQGFQAWIIFEITLTSIFAIVDGIKPESRKLCVTLVWILVSCSGFLVFSAFLLTPFATRFDNVHYLLSSVLSCVGCLLIALGIQFDRSDIQGAGEVIAFIAVIVGMLKAIVDLLMLLFGLKNRNDEKNGPKLPKDRQEKDLVCCEVEEEREDVEKDEVQSLLVPFLEKGTAEANEQNQRAATSTKVQEAFLKESENVKEVLMTEGVVDQGKSFSLEVGDREERFEMQSVPPPAWEQQQQQLSKSSASDEIFPLFLPMKTKWSRKTKKSADCATQTVSDQKSFQTPTKRLHQVLQYTPRFFTPAPKFVLDDGGDRCEEEKCLSHSRNENVTMDEEEEIPTTSLPKLR